MPKYNLVPAVILKKQEISLLAIREGLTAVDFQSLESGFLFIGRLIAVLGGWCASKAHKENKWGIRFFDPRKQELAIQAALLIYR
jgi:hypothetical protein